MNNNNIGSADSRASSRSQRAHWRRAAASRKHALAAAAAAAFAAAVDSVASHPSVAASAASDPSAAPTDPTDPSVAASTDTADASTNTAAAQVQLGTGAELFPAAVLRGDTEVLFTAHAAGRFPDRCLGPVRMLWDKLQLAATDEIQPATGNLQHAAHAAAPSESTSVSRAARVRYGTRTRIISPAVLQLGCESSHAVVRNVLLWAHIATVPHLLHALNDAVAVETVASAAQNTLAAPGSAVAPTSTSSSPGSAVAPTSTSSSPSSAHHVPRAAVTVRLVRPPLCRFVLRGADAAAAARSVAAAVAAAERACASSSDASSNTQLSSFSALATSTSTNMQSFSAPAISVSTDTQSFSALDAAAALWSSLNTDDDVDETGLLPAGLTTRADGRSVGISGSAATAATGAPSASSATTGNVAAIANVAPSSFSAGAVVNSAAVENATSTASLVSSATKSKRQIDGDDEFIPLSGARTSTLNIAWSVHPTGGAGTSTARHARAPPLLLLSDNSHHHVECVSSLDSTSSSNNGSSSSSINKSSNGSSSSSSSSITIIVPRSTGQAVWLALVTQGAAHAVGVQEWRAISTLATSTSSAACAQHAQECSLASSAVSAIDEVTVATSTSHGDSQRDATGEEVSPTNQLQPQSSRQLQLHITRRVAAAATSLDRGIAGGLPFNFPDTSACAEASAASSYAAFIT